MNPDPIILELISKLRLPAQDQTMLSFCQSNRATKVAAWAYQLPATRINHTSVMLYQALPEVCRLDTSPANRLDILEHLRPYVQQCIQGLAQSFLGQPLILPEGAMKTAVIAQALQKHMGNGYCLVIKELLHKSNDNKFKEDELDRLGIAIHRAISGIGLQFLRNAQIYTQVSNQLWLELNTLYYLAEHLGLLKKAYKDPILKELSHNSIEHAYFRILLLSAAHPNQLRQNEVNSIYDALEDWSRLVRLTPFTEHSENLFGIDLNSGHPPTYKSQLQPSQGLRELNITPLLDALRHYEDQGASSHTPIQVPGNITTRLLQHVRNHWGEEYHRNQPRKASSDQLEVAVGLTNVHYHLAGQEPFDHFLRETCNIRSRIGSQFSMQDLHGAYDPWDDAFDAETESKTLGGKPLNIPEAKIAAAISNKYPLYQVQISDASPGGYGLEWREQIPPQATAGELIALRQPNNRQWSLGVIRWVKQHRGTSKLGIQLIALQAHAIAVQQLQKAGADNVLMRGLISGKAGEGFNQKAIITANIPFRTQNKVRMNQQGVTSMVQLQHLLHGTSSINMFDYRTLDADPRAPAEDAPPAGDFPEDW